MTDEMTVMDLYEKYCDRIKSTGSSQYTSLCPFPDHPDRNPSFSFNTLSTKYYCFGCSVSGNAITFAQFFGEDPTPFYSDDYKSNRTLINNGKTTVKNKTVTPKLDLTDKAEEYHENLGENYDNEFYAQRVGWHKKRLTFPYFNNDGDVIGIKHHKKYWEGDGEKKWYLEWMLDDYDRNEPLIICEGEKDAVIMLKKYNVLSGSGGCSTIPGLLNSFKEFKKPIILYDKDEAGQIGADKLAQAIYDELNLIVDIAQWRDELPNGFDPSDDMDWKEIEYAIENRKSYKPIPGSGVQNKKGYKVVKLTDAFEMDIEKPKMIVEDILNERGNTLIAAEDNVGKSMMANQLGLCIATGTDFLGYRVPKPRKVLLVQHEMENGEQIDRLRKQSALYFKVHPELIEQNVKLHLIEDGENLAIVDQFDVLDITLKENPDIEVVVFDNIGQSTNVEMTKPDAIRNELKRLKALCRIHSVAFILVAHHVKIDWAKEMDLTKRQIQGGKPITDWADNIIQLHTSSMNPNLVLFKITKIRSIHNNEGHSTKLLNQAVWFNQDNDLLFNKMFAVSNWEGHFTALDKHERELDFVKELNDYPQPFETNDAMNVGDKMNISISTIKGYWLPKLCKWEWLNKEGHGKYSVNKETLQFLISEELNY
jgi:5S rRNA maturation endonuclease (ribonuclease M5)